MWGKQQILICISVYFVVLCGGQDKIKNDVAFQSKHSNPKINLDIYLESLCPDSHAFISRQLNPSWKDIADHVNIRFVPFGKSFSLENGTKFSCQHGAAECKGNRIMSCALSRIADQTLQVKYVACFMEIFKNAKFNANELGQKCVEVLGYDFNEIIQNCYLKREGTLRQLQAEIDTDKISPAFIPTVVFEGIYDQAIQDASLRNFYDVVCMFIKQINPEACKYRSTITI